MKPQSFYQYIIPNNELPFRILIHDSGKQHTVLNHWHDSFEIDFVIHGTNSNYYLDGKLFNQLTDEIVVVNPYQVHGLNLPKEIGRIAITIMIPLKFLKQLGFDYSKYHIQNIIKVTENEKYYSLRRLFLKLYGISSSKGYSIKKGRLLIQIGLIYQIMGELLSNYSYIISKKQIKSENIHILESAIKFMNNNYKEDLRIEDISNNCNLSDSYFAHVFKTYMNETPMNYLNQVRVTHSLELLRNTDQITSLVAQNVGFTNVKSFNKSFKKQYGVTPYLYKKQNMT